MLPNTMVRFMRMKEHEIAKLHNEIVQEKNV